MEYEAVIAAWMDLGIRVEAPYTLNDEYGQQYQYVAYIRDFGNKKGTLIPIGLKPNIDYDTEALNVAKKNGFYYSILNTECYSDYKEEFFKATSDDWGYFGPPELKPFWYTEMPWTK
jgi:hypothetical protein